MSWYKVIVKPVFDFVFAVILLIVFWPFLLVIFLINMLTFRKPLFTQTRIGLRELPFSCIKFRTLHKDGDESSIPLWGRFLRTSSIDELPQLINVIRGEMSFIGPRPLLPEYLSHYSEEQRKRHLVKPGISGLAQVSGRNRLSWEESLALDVEYAEKLAFWLDVQILLKTIGQVFKIKEVNDSSSISRKPFNKSN
jgi:lipopolysaccharide/colanic/teichoic acid biosynthesis glycosyltransferase